MIQAEMIRHKVEQQFNPRRVEPVAKSSEAGGAAKTPKISQAPIA